MKTHLVLGLLASAVLVGAMPTSTNAQTFVYISIGGEQKIAIYQADSATGELHHSGDLNVGGAVGAQGVSPDKRFLFAALRSTSQLASFAINPKTGALKPVSRVDAKGSAAFVATDRTGRFLLSAYYGEGKVAVHRISKDGVLSEDPLQTVATAPKAHAILTDRSNTFAFVPHTGPNAIFQFTFNAQTGRLAANAVSKLKTPDGTEPRHLGFHPSKNYVYYSNERLSAVTACLLDAKSGTLKPIQTVSTLPQGYSQNNSNAHLEVTPNGRFVYVSNRGHDSIAGFRIDEKTGKVTAIGRFATEKTPRSFNVEPSGRFLYAAGQGNGKLAAYRINKKHGKLTRFATYEVGKGPAWVQAVRVGE